MTDTLTVVFAYGDCDPEEAQDRVAGVFSGPEWSNFDVTGPEVEYGVSTLRVRDRSDGGSVSGMIEAVPAGDRASTPGIPSLEFFVTRDDIELGETEAHVETLLDVVRAIYDATETTPRFVYGLDPFHYQGIGEVPRPVTAERIDDGTLQNVSWLLLFPPAFVEAFGRGKLLQAPAWHVEEFDDGAVLLVAVADPTDPNGVDYSELREHLGIEDPS